MYEQAEAFPQAQRRPQRHLLSTPLPASRAQSFPRMLLRPRRQLVNCPSLVAETDYGQTFVRMMWRFLSRGSTPANSRLGPIVPNWMGLDNPTAVFDPARIPSWDGNTPPGVPAMRCLFVPPAAAWASRV